MNTLRILEIGDRWLFADTLPASTDLLWTGTRPLTPTANRHNFYLRGAWKLFRALRRPVYDVIVCHAPLYNPLSLRWLLRMIGRYPLTFPLHWFRSCGVLLLRLPTHTPILALDTEDIALINRHNFFLLGVCRAYFKRELPPDHWKAFTKTAHPNTPTPRFRRKPFFIRAVAKLRPLSLGISEAKVQQIEEALQDHLCAEKPDDAGNNVNENERNPANAVSKSVDVFFAGAVENSLVRERGREQLVQLREQGYAIDIAEPNLTPSEYFARCARAWLVWSPEGYGWDCFRHYETSVCGSVPLMNLPTIHRHQPLLNGVHCWYYDVENNGLQTAIVQALQDKPRLTAMAEAAHKHVLRHHTHRQLCETMLEAALPADK